MLARTQIWFKPKLHLLPSLVVQTLQRFMRWACDSINYECWPEHKFDLKLWRFVQSTGCFWRHSEYNDRNVGAISSTDHIPIYKYRLLVSCLADLSELCRVRINKCYFHSILSKSVSLFLDLSTFIFTEKSRFKLKCRKRFRPRLNSIDP